jgi:PAS domain S-box-containing protein
MEEVIFLGATLFSRDFSMSDCIDRTGELEQELHDLRERRVKELEEAERKRKRAEAELRKYEASYRAIFEAANDGIFIHDLETGAVVDVNPKSCEMYGLPAEDCRGATVERLSSGVPPYTKDDAMCWIRRAASGEPQLFEWHARKRNGDLFWVEVNLKRSELGGKDYLLAVVRDISDRKRAEAELKKAHEELELRVQERTAELLKVNEELTREISERRRMETWLRDSERRYRVLVDDIPDVIFILDHRGCFSYVNIQVEAFLGYSVRSILETPLKRYLIEEDQPRVDTMHKLPLDAVWDEEVGLIDVHGAVKHSRIRCKVLRVDHNGPFRFEGVMRDISRRKTLEQELKTSRQELLEKIRIIDDLYAHLVEAGKSKAIADHTAEVAHELRQPLAIIGGLVRRLAKHLETCDEAREQNLSATARVIVSEVQRLETILKGLIEFTHRENLVLLKADPNEIIERVLKLFEDLAAQRGIRLRKNLGKEVGEIYLDDRRFDQVMRNIVANAIEASDPGETVALESGVSIPSCKAYETGGLECETYFEVKVKYSAPALSQEELQDIFSPFSTTKRFGSGIGLTLSKKIVEDHGGSISVQSNGEETVFTVWLPISEPEPGTNGNPLSALS